MHRRLAIFVLLFALLTGGATAAFAKSMKGTDANDRIVGTARSDKINGRGGDDQL
ncbi:MAG: hypothetical protein QOG42_1899, partial [Solirubrobacteraceae bacterium]|nr:hypothetical protein [Solirubrobacteraceae bacterium]